MTGVRHSSAYNGWRRALPARLLLFFGFAVAITPSDGLRRDPWASLKDLRATLVDPEPELEDGQNLPKVIEDGVYHNFVQSEAPSTQRQVNDGSCDYDEYLAYHAANKDEAMRAGMECYEAIDALRLRPFGPPTEWERTRVVCYGVCAQYYSMALSINVAGGCSCLTLDESYSWQVYRKRDVDTCFVFPQDFMCEISGVCPISPAYHWRHSCRGCGWEALNEDQWHEERDPDFGCPSSRAGPELTTIVVAGAVLALALQRHRFGW